VCSREEFDIPKSLDKQIDKVEKDNCCGFELLSDREMVVDKWVKHKRGCYKERLLPWRDKMWCWGNGMRWLAWTGSHTGDWRDWRGPRPRRDEGKR
jgi:hypothetical protein